MSDTILPAAEVDSVGTLDERNAYELAFHVLPTVAEGEVTRVFEELKSHISRDGGEVTSSEAPERFELAYEIVKHLEGKNRAFKTAYFGWIRFKTDAVNIAKLSDELEHRTDILRHLVIKLTKTEEAMPFYFHQALAKDKVVMVDVEEALAHDALAGETVVDAEVVVDEKVDEVVKEEEKA